jgi:hypothetical protein
MDEEYEFLILPILVLKNTRESHLESDFSR